MHYLLNYLWFVVSSVTNKEPRTLYGKSKNTRLYHGIERLRSGSKSKTNLVIYKTVL
jgi:hypothetical protein